MISENYNTKQKQIYFKAFQNLSELETALKLLHVEGFSNEQISVLGSTTQFYLDIGIEESKNTDSIKMYWTKIWGNTLNFGTFNIPQIETVFVIGPLASIFLHEINGKPLATLSSGTYGVFRGIGASETQANTSLKLLSSGSYILILRGFKNKMKNLDTLLNQQVLAK